MPALEENFHLVWLLLQQKTTDGNLEGIDWNAVTESLGLANKAAATMRWTRLKKEIADKGIPTASTNTPVKTPKKPATPKKTAAEKGENGEKPAKAKRTPKKRKLEVVEEAETNGGHQSEDDGSGDLNGEEAD